MSPSSPALNFPTRTLAEVVQIKQRIHAPRFVFITLPDQNSPLSARGSPTDPGQFAIAGLSKSTSLDGRKHSITCTQLDIGNAQTSMGSHVSKGALQADGSLKVEPMMDVENVGKTLVFLAGLPSEADVLHISVV